MENVTSNVCRLCGHEKKSQPPEHFLPPHSYTNVYQAQSGGFFFTILHNRSSLLVRPSVASAVAARASSGGALVALQRCQEGQQAYDVLNESRNVCQQKVASEKSRLQWSRSSACCRNLQLCEKIVFGPCHNLLTRTENPCLLILLRSHELCCNPVSLN